MCSEKTKLPLKHCALQVTCQNGNHAPLFVTKSINTSGNSWLVRHEAMMGIWPDSYPRVARETIYPMPSLIKPSHPHHCPFAYKTTHTWWVLELEVRTWNCTLSSVLGESTKGKAKTDLKSVVCLNHSETVPSLHFYLEDIFILVHFVLVSISRFERFH